jgi:hypothetical protein
MNPDFVDLLRALRDADARFLIVGAYALAYYGRPRATGDLDIWIDATPENAPRIMGALAAFGAPLTEVTEQDFSRPGIVFQIGVPPGRIDVLTELTAITFAEAWPTREPGQFGDVAVDFLGRDAFIRNKRATGVRRTSEISRASDSGNRGHATRPSPQLLEGRWLTDDSPAVPSSGGQTSSPEAGWRRCSAPRRHRRR